MDEVVHQNLWRSGRMWHHICCIGIRLFPPSMSVLCISSLLPPRAHTRQTCKQLGKLTLTLRLGRVAARRLTGLTHSTVASVISADHTVSPRSLTFLATAAASSSSAQRSSCIVVPDISTLHPLLTHSPHCQRYIVQQHFVTATSAALQRSRGRWTPVLNSRLSLTYVAHFLFFLRWQHAASSPSFAARRRSISFKPLVSCSYRL